MMRTATIARSALGNRWVLALGAGALLGCGEDAAGPESLGPPGVPVSVTAELRPDLPTFKRDGRLEAGYTLASPFAGTVDAGIVVIPAGRRTSTRDVRLPELEGTLTLRETTSSPVVPFLCGTAGLIDPRVDRAVTVVVALCLP